MIEERSIYHNVDTINTFPTKKKEFVNGVLGLGFMGNQTRRNGPSLCGIESLYNGLSKTTKYLDI
jgi:hypothetical protein